MISEDVDEAMFLDSLGSLLEKTRKNIGEIIGSENVEVQAKEILKILGTLISGWNKLHTVQCLRQEKFG